jgi:hypothetical protein
MKFNDRKNLFKLTAFGIEKSKSLRAALLIFTFSLACFAQQNNFKVSVKVESNDKQIQDEIENHITRRLLALGDVEVSDENAYYEIKIIGVEDEKTVAGGVRRNSGSSGKSGSTLSAVINWRATCLGAGQRKNCYVLDDHLLLKGGAGDLENLCEKIISHFDANSLKPLRPTAKL